MQDLPTELLFRILELAFDEPFDLERTIFLRQTSLVASAWRKPSQWFLTAHMSFSKWTNGANEARKAHLAQAEGSARVVKLNFFHDSAQLLEEVLDGAEGFEDVSLPGPGDTMPAGVLSHPHLSSKPEQGEAVAER